MPACRYLPRLFPLMLVTVLLAACSGIKSYPESEEKNFIVHTLSDSGSVYTNINVAIDIYLVNSDCSGSYAGTVKLSKSKICLGIEPDKLSYLSFRFDRRALLGTSRSRITFNTLVMPRHGYLYEAKVSYKDDLYNVEIYEKRTEFDKGRKLPTYSLDECSEIRNKRGR